MTKAEKIRKIQRILELKDSREDLYADLLKINASGETCCCLWRNLWMAAGFIFFVRKVKKSGTRTPWNSRRWFLAMGKIELIDTGRLTEKQARLNMEKCAEFLARMIQKYGDSVLGEIEERNAQLQGK